MDAHAKRTDVKTGEMRNMATDGNDLKADKDERNSTGTGSKQDLNLRRTTTRKVDMVILN